VELRASKAALGEAEGRIADLEETVQASALRTRELESQNQQAAQARTAAQAEIHDRAMQLRQRLEAAETALAGERASASEREEKLAALERELQERDRRVAALNRSATAAETELEKSRGLVVHRTEEPAVLRGASLAASDGPWSNGQRDTQELALVPIDAGQLIGGGTSVVSRLQAVFFRVWLTHPYRALAAAVGVGAVVAVLVSASIFGASAQPAATSEKEGGVTAPGAALPHRSAGATVLGPTIEQGSPEAKTAAALSSGSAATPAETGHRQETPAPQNAADGTGDRVSAGQAMARPDRGRATPAPRSSAAKRKAPPKAPSSEGIDDLFDAEF
jgi:hypothetical protein